MASALYVHKAAHVLHRCEIKASHTSCIRVTCVWHACHARMLHSSNIIIGAVRVHTIRAARVHTAFTVHSWGTPSTALFYSSSFCTCPTCLSEIPPKCSTRVACMSEVCAMRVYVCNWYVPHTCHTHYISVRAPLQHTMLYSVNSSVGDLDNLIQCHKSRLSKKEKNAHTIRTTH